MGVGNNIRAFRMIAGMTQEELAEKTGYKSRAAINKIEKEVNSLPLDKLKVFSEVLDVPVPVLLGDESSVTYAIKKQMEITGDYIVKKDPMSEEISMIVEISKSMNDDGVQRLLQYAEDIKDKYRKE